MPPEPSRTSSVAHVDTGDDGDAFSDHETTSTSEVDAYERRRAKKRYIILAISSVILVTSTVVMIQSGMFNIFFGLETNDSKGRDASVVRASIQALCSLTEFEDVCVSSIEERIGPDNDGHNNKALVLISMQGAIAAIEKAYNYSASLAKEGMGWRAAAAFRDCEELLMNAEAELQSSCASIDSMTSGSAPFKMPGTRSSISASISFQRTCFDGLASTGSDPVARMRELVKNATEETRNNLSIISGYPSIMTHGNNRRLLEEAVEESLWQAGGKSPTVVVAQDGSGNYRTIGEALREATKPRDDRFVIYVKEGVYNENVEVTREMKGVTIHGDGMERTVVVGSKAFGDGDTVYATATFAVSGPAFMARDIGFKNNAGPEKAQAVALRVDSDLSVFYNCCIDGYENTLLALAHRQFYRNCLIFGTVDIISGDAAALFQNCNIMLKKPLANQSNTITAHARVDRNEPTGIVMQNCTVAPAAELVPANDETASYSYLGRPAEEFSVAVIMQSMIADVIRSEGWAEPPDDGAVSSNSTESAFLAEFENRGPGASVLQRVAWPAHRVLRDAAEVAKFTVDEFIAGAWWLSMTGVPFYSGVAVQ